MELVKLINRKRLIGEFIELVKIDSLSFKERFMADNLKRKLKASGYSVYEDNTGSKIGGNTGNIICKVEGKNHAPTILLMAHMDTVSPGIGKNPTVQGNMIRSDGSTVLGGDDVTGIVCILEALRVIEENNLPHGGIEIVFSVAEEVGLLGAVNLDYRKLESKYGFVLDIGGKIGTAVVSAPENVRLEVSIEGKAAHAGIEPEKGINAISVAAEAIAQMRLGRIDEETTANIGIIKGGTAVNIVCGKVEIKAEARSMDKNKLAAQVDHMRQALEGSASKAGAILMIKEILEYPSFKLNEDDEIISILKKASDKSKIPLLLGTSGGGSDANIVNSKGIQTVVLSTGMSKVHTTDEEICIDDMADAVRLLVSIIQSLG